MSDAQRYTQRWRFVFDPMSLETIDDLISTLEAFADALPALREWRALGVQLDPAEADENVADGYLGFCTTDAGVAQKLGFDMEEDEGDEP